MSSRLHWLQLLEFHEFLFKLYFHLSLRPKWATSDYLWCALTLLRVIKMPYMTLTSVTQTSHLQLCSDVFLARGRSQLCLGHVAWATFNPSILLSLLDMPELIFSDSHDHVHADRGYLYNSHVKLLCRNWTWPHLLVSVSTIALASIWFQHNEGKKDLPFMLEYFSYLWKQDAQISLIVVESDSSRWRADRRVMRRTELSWMFDF